MAMWARISFVLFIIFGCVEGLKVSVQKFIGNVDYIRAEIRREDLDTGSPLTEDAKLNALRNTNDTDYDTPGLLIPESLGGHGNETYNVVPFATHIYQQYWGQVEDVIYDFVNQEGMVIYQVFVYYTNTTRPHSFAVIAQTEDELSTRATTYKVYKAFILNKYGHWLVVPNQVSLTYTEPYENLIGPIKHSGRGFKTRVEYLRAYLDNPLDLKGGTNATEDSDKYAADIMGIKSGDVALTLLTAALGGPGNETYNIISVARDTRDRWNSQQARLTAVVNDGGRLDLRMWMVYSNAEETRPSALVGFNILYLKSGVVYYQSILYVSPAVSWASGSSAGGGGGGGSSICTLPNKINGTSFKFQDERNLNLKTVYQNKWIPEFSVLVFSCEEGFAFPQVKGKYNTRSRCKNGKWNKLHKCIRVPRDGECTLPLTSNTTSFKVAWCKEGDTSDTCNSVEGTIVRQFTVLNYTCAEGYAYPRGNGKPITRSYCVGGTWFPPNFKCLKTCDPMSTDTMETECEFEGKSVPCDKPAHQGTILRPKCKPYYRPQKTVTAYTETRCRKNGKWGYHLFKCIPDCGLSFGEEKKQQTNSIDNVHTKNLLTSRILNGVRTNSFEAPWHAGLFRYNDDTGNFTYFCGGTIVSPHFILTAAHCVFDPLTLQNMFPEDIQVVVGKSILSWDHQDPLEQKIGVEKIHTLELYRGNKNFYMQDASLLQLERVITLTHVAIPVCIDWLRDGTYLNGTVGSIVGFGQDEAGETSTQLKSAKLTYIDYNTCYEQAPVGFHSYLHNDKFCAGSHSEVGTSTRKGDSGGGFTFIRGNHHFLYGILSSRPIETNRFAVYTNISVHLKWLYQRLNHKEFGTEAYVYSYSIY